MLAKGSFEVALNPAEPYAKSLTSNQLDRMTLDKQFYGDLQARSQGEMLSARCGDGTAGYVAIEQVTGTLMGKNGSFVLQHFGIMDQDGQQLTLEVLPGSGTDELAGLSGNMDIRIEEGLHFYQFEFALPE